MSPAQFLRSVTSGNVPPVCLFLGCEAFEKRRCREALLAAHLGPEYNASGGLTQYDASQISLSEIVDDARALSLFVSNRVILVIGAEAAVPRASRASEEEDDEEGSASASGSKPLDDYLKDPSPGTVLLFEATRFDLEGDEKKKSDRVRKFYSTIREVVEFKRLSPDEARIELQAIAKRLELRIDPAASAMLIESLGADMGRIATEVEKLSLFAGKGRTVTPDDIVDLIPDARASTVFTLVNALGRGDRSRALASLDALCRENEYLPLALAFLSTQMRQSLAAKQAGLRTSQQVQSYFTKSGMPMWGGRAEQVAQTAQKLTVHQLEANLALIAKADRDLRNARPDDRIVMEEFVIRLTA